MRKSLNQHITAHGEKLNVSIPQKNVLKLTT